MNAIMTQDKKIITGNCKPLRVKGSASVGNAGAEIKKQSYKEEVDLQQTPEFRLRLERTNSGFITSWAPAGSDEWVSKSVPRADLISVQDNAHYYVGFFASRNAKITVTGASLTTSPAHTLESAPGRPKLSLLWCNLLPAARAPLRSIWYRHAQTTMAFSASGKMKW
jgi:pectate disaccharide-lyase